MKNVVFLTFIGIIVLFLSSVFGSSLRVEAESTSEDGKVKEVKEKVKEVKDEPADCVSVYDGMQPSSKNQRCIDRGIRKSRCGAHSDIPCLCDSLFVRHIVSNCTGSGSLFDFDPFGPYFLKLCMGAVLPQPRCMNIPNPVFPTVTCEDPFGSFNISEPAKLCMTREGNESLCKGYKHVSCECDSRTANFGFHKCMEMHPEDADKIKEGLERLCGPSPPASAQCRRKDGKVLIRPRPDDDSGSKVMLKELILLIIGITIPVTLGLIN